MNKRKIALFDIDDTLYKGPSTFHFTKHLSHKEVLTKNDLKVLQEDIDKYFNGEVDYTLTVTNILKHFAESLTGKHEGEIQALAKNYFKDNAEKFYDYTIPLFALLQNTHDVYLITSAPTFIAQAVMSLFDKHIKNSYGTVYETLDGFFTGKVKKQTNKEEITLILLENYEKFDSFAFGDSIDDVKMFMHIKKPICINPKEDLKKLAQQQSWDIVNEDNILQTVKAKLSK